MPVTDLKLVQAWLWKAAHDLAGAKKLSGEGDPLDVAIYHCQQAAEKAVKAYLSHAGAPIEKTHDVERLIKMAAKHLPEFSKWLDEAEIITPYATRFRYPMEDVPMEPDRSEFEEALNASQRLFDFVLSVLPTETHPV
jgi:HEPN domain-containing protein